MMNYLINIHKQCSELHTSVRLNRKSGFCITMLTKEQKAFVRELKDMTEDFTRNERIKIYIHPLRGVVSRRYIPAAATTYAHSFLFDHKNVRLTYWCHKESVVISKRVIEKLLIKMPNREDVTVTWGTTETDDDFAVFTTDNKDDGERTLLWKVLHPCVDEYLELRR